MQYLKRDSFPMIFITSVICSLQFYIISNASPLHSIPPSELLPPPPSYPYHGLPKFHFQPQKNLHSYQWQLGLFRNILSSLLYGAESSPQPETTVSLASKAGYTAESHEVTTDDGYVLTLHHILPKNDDVTFAILPGHRKYPRILKTEDDIENSKINTEDEKNTKVVFLQHGLMGSSDNWNTNTREQSLAHQLSDRGYDVWMGNFRGNVYSRDHLNMSHTDPEFWRFSFQEMAEYDLPSMLRYVVNATRVSQLHYIGHSMGSTVCFAAMSDQPHLQEMIASMIAFAPVTQMTTSQVLSPIKYLVPIATEIQAVLRLLGNDQELMTNRLLISLYDPYRICHSNQICENLQFFITGFDPERAHQEMLPVILTHNPAGASTQTLFHFAQGIASGKFRKFDLGLQKNLRAYGQSTPPEYDVTKIKVPVTLFWAPNDWMLGEMDVRRLELRLPNLQRSYKVSNSQFSHLDFLWAKDAHELVYKKVFNILENRGIIEGLEKDLEEGKYEKTSISDTSIIDSDRTDLKENSVASEDKLKEPLLLEESDTKLSSTLGYSRLRDVFVNTLATIWGTYW